MRVPLACRQTWSWPGSTWRKKCRQFVLKADSGISACSCEAVIEDGVSSLATQTHPCPYEQTKDAAISRHRHNVGGNVMRSDSHAVSRPAYRISILNKPGCPTCSIRHYWWKEPSHWCPPLILASRRSRNTTSGVSNYMGNPTVLSTIEGSEWQGVRSCRRVLLPEAPGRHW